MTMDIRNLTPEQKQMILAAGKDGFSAEELRELGLNKQIAEALYNSLAGEAEEVGDKAKFSSDKDTARAERDKLDKEAKAKKQKYKDDASIAFKEGNYGEWIKNTWNHAVAPNGAYSQAKSPLMGALPFVVALVATSCDVFKLGPNDTIYYEGEETVLEKVEGNTNIINIVDIDVNISIVDSGMKLEDFALLFNNALNQIIEALNKNGDKITDQIDLAMNTIISYLEGKGLDSLSVIKQLLEKLLLDNNANQESIKVILDEINKKLGDLSLKCGDMLADNKTLHEIITLLKDQKFALADIIAALQKNNVTLEQIVAELQAQGESLDLIIAELNKNGYALSDIKDLLVQNNIDNAAILEAMSEIIGQGTEVGKKLDEIVGLLKTGITLDQETHNILNKILDAMNNVQIGGGSGSGNVDTTNIEKALAAILDAITKLPTEGTVKQMNEETKVFLETIVNLINEFKTENKAMGENLAQLIANFANSFELFASYEKISDEDLKKTIESFKNEVIEAINNIKINVDGNFGGGNITVDLSEIENMMAKMLEMMSKMPTADQLDQNQKVMLERFEELTKLLNNFMTQNKADNAKIQELVANLSAAFDLFAAGEQIRDEELKKVVENLSAFIEKFAAQENLADEKSLEAINNVLEAVKNLKIKVEGNFGGGDVTVDLSGVEAALASILAAINNLPTKDNMIQMNEDLINSINKLTDLVNKFMANEADMDAKELELAQQILDKISNLKLEAGDVTIDLSNLEAMMAILVDKVGNLEGGVAKLVELALAGNENIENLIKVVQAFKDDTKADLNDIKELLKAVKDGVDNNGKALLENNEKLDIVILTLKELKDQYPDLNAKLDEVIAKLGEILAKIPEGCDCNVDQILVKLDLIITELQKNPGNEGIVDDLDDLLQ